MPIMAMHLIELVDVDVEFHFHVTLRTKTIKGQQFRLYSFDTVRFILIINVWKLLQVRAAVKKSWKRFLKRQWS